MKAIALLKECRDSLAECSIDPFDGHRSDADSSTLDEYDEAVSELKLLMLDRADLLEALQKITRMDYGNPYAAECANTAREVIARVTGETA